MTDMRVLIAGAGGRMGRTLVWRLSRSEARQGVDAGAADSVSSRGETGPIGVAGAAAQ